MNKEVAGRRFFPPRAPGPRACRRHGARRLIICAARTGKSLAARARRRLSGGKCDWGRGALRSVVLLEKARDNTVAAAATPHDRGGRGDRVQGRRRRLWSSSRVRCDGRRRGHVDGRQGAVVSAWPHCAHCQRGATRAGDPPHTGGVLAVATPSRQRALSVFVLVDLGCPGFLVCYRTL